MSERKVVMVCEDNPDVGTLYKDELGKSYDVIHASSGDTLMRKYIERFDKGQRVDLILTNYDAVGMSGPEIVYTIHEMSRGNPPKSIILVENEDPSLLKNLESEKILNKHLDKSVKLKDLYEEVRSLIGV